MVSVDCCLGLQMFGRQAIWVTDNLETVVLSLGLWPQVLVLDKQVLNPSLLQSTLCEGTYVIVMCMYGTGLGQDTSLRVDVILPPQSLCAYR